MTISKDYWKHAATNAPARQYEFEGFPRGHCISGHKRASARMRLGGNI
jgi:hypothetical protein